MEGVLNTKEKGEKRREGGSEEGWSFIYILHISGFCVLISVNSL